MSNLETEQRLFVVTAPGLEAITAREMRALGLAGRRVGQPTVGGLEFAGSLRDLYRLNLHLRTASRVIVRLGEFYAAAFSELRKKASYLPWERYLRPGQPVAVRATCHQSKLYHSDAVAERVLGAIGDRMGAPAELAAWDEDSPETPPQGVVVRLSNNMATVSMDSSGALLHRRGYRLATAKAPLRETLAAAMLLASEWDMEAPLLDPFCGSGTIPIEAALLARQIAPGKIRRFAFMDWTSFAADLWAEEHAAALAAEREVMPLLLASDRDAGAIRAAEANAGRAGVSGAITFTCQAVSAVTPPLGPGWVVTNPPYGVRVSADKDLRNLYAQLGNVLRMHCPRWQVALLCNGLPLLQQARLQLEPPQSWVNGGLRVLFARGVVRD
ncbi:MAG: class I SAM-dependent RNA methyltransferase [Anaerolineae bacterium]|jgi:putative N6-adenine-specific DNA methylase|nr:class I SAM-dependent RNA methyltransferase [Anaerolineae bacterium]